jgi:phosphoglycolate phosphatase
MQTSPDMNAEASHQHNDSIENAPSNSPILGNLGTKLPEDTLPSGSSAKAELGVPAEAPKKIRYRAKPKFALPTYAKAILIDLDGTLLDTAGDIIAAANKMRGTFGFAPLEAAVIRNFIGKGLADLVAKTLKDAVGEVGPTALKVAMANFERQYETCFEAESAPYPGVIDGLNAMKAAGFRLGCVTNKIAKFTEPLLASTGLRDYFEIVVSGDTVAEKKPHPMPLLHAAEFFACEPAEMVMIGDSINDAAAARAAGCPVFIVPYGYNEGQELRGLDCDAFIDDLPLALKFVKLST